MPVHGSRLLAQPPSEPFRLHRSSVQAAGLIGWWPGALYGGEARDVARFHNGAMNGTITSATDGQFGRIMTWPGSGANYLRALIAPDIKVLGSQITCAAWIKRTSSATDGAIISEMQAASGFVHFSFWCPASANIGFFYHDSGEGYHEFDTTSGGVDTNWHHVAVSFVFGSGSAKCYLDGVLMTGSWASGNGLGGENTGSADDLFIGRLDHGSFPHQFVGSMADVRLYNRPLGPSEIWQMWDPKTRWDLYQPMRRRVNAKVPAAATARSFAVMIG